MQYTVHIRQTKDGRLVADYRWTCETRRPTYFLDDTDAWEAEGGQAWLADDDRPLAVGDIYMIGIDEYAGPNNDRALRLVWSPDNGEGWSGNSDRTIKCYHGWRGTTNDWAFYGHGVRRCLAVRETGRRSRRTVVVFGRDLKAHED